MIVELGKHYFLKEEHNQGRINHPVGTEVVYLGHYGHDDRVMVKAIGGIGAFMIPIEKLRENKNQ